MTQIYVRLLKEWETLMEWHKYVTAEEDKPKGKMSDWLREKGYCDSKDKKGEGHSSYIRLTQAYGKILEVPEDERVGFIQGKIDRYTVNGKKAEELKANGHKAMVSRKAFNAVLECLEMSVSRLKEQVALDEEAILRTDRVKTRIRLNKAVLDHVAESAPGWIIRQAPAIK